MDRRTATSRPTRFTLVELMIVVAIVAVLAAIAIPSLAQMQIRARFAESFVNMDGIDLATRAAIVDNLITTSDYGVERPRPSTSVDKTPTPWNAPTGDWTVVPYAPDGDVRCAYAWNVTASGRAYATVNAACDVDGDSAVQILYLNYLIGAGTSVEGALSGKATSHCVFDGRENLNDCPVY